MNDKAKVFADYYTRCKVGDGNTLNIYYDGLVVAVKGSPDRHLAIREYMKTMPGFEEARVGNLSVFLVPLDVGTTSPKDLPPMLRLPTIMGGYIDHRDERMTMMKSILDIWKPDLEIPNVIHEQENQQ